MVFLSWTATSHSAALSSLLQMPIWVDAADGAVPAHAVGCPSPDRPGEQEFVGRAEHHGTYMSGKVVPWREWCRLCSLRAVPLLWLGHVAVQQGIQAAARQCTLAVALVRATLLPARQKSVLVSSHDLMCTADHCLYLPWSGKEHAYRSYQVLTVGEAVILLVQTALPAVPKVCARVSPPAQLHFRALVCPAAWHHAGA